MVHKPIPLTQAMRIPDAKAALEKRWKKLEGINSWDVKGVQPRQKVIERARKSGITIHFGNIMPLCHQKNAEQGIEFRSYKGRIVFRGDAVKDESGFYAVFSEQGSSASHMAATKFIDAIARMPGCSGEDSDAVAAYTQIPLKDAARLLGMGVMPETWISLPRNRWPSKLNFQFFTLTTRVRPFLTKSCNQA